ncbi:hypothetical protein CMEL01_16567 [Colletotrichum melonis]|uniref:Fungal lipase-type domain-containing protein n=1 Tax=Colletotrichum melonis TaxID=1209925 RepID=A0AAI9XNP6_9PEZI|nr:hypothetical protein CMEL01_16567 [Colletotrichum melonis]
MSVARHSLGASASGAGSMGSTTLAGASAAVATMLNEIEDFSKSDFFGLVRESQNKKVRAQRALDLRDVVSRGQESVKLPTVEWTSTEDAARINQIAALCSKAVYKKDPGHVVPQLLDYANKDRHWIEPTRDGSGKAAALFEILPTDPSAQRKVLVVAVRGSASSIDWLVNLNSDLAECSDLVKLPESRLKPTLKVHRGFAQSARTVAPGLVYQIKAALNESQTEDQEIEIVFIGHSADGAVACLLFCHLLTSQVLDLPSKKPTLSCVHFGCPLLFNTDIDARLTKIYTDSNFLRGNILAFVNDGDPIPRMDAAYATELTRIWYRVGGGKCPPASEFQDFKPPKLRLNGLGQLVFYSKTNRRLMRTGTGTGTETRTRKRMKKKKRESWHASLAMTISNTRPGRMLRRTAWTNM